MPLAQHDATLRNQCKPVVDSADRACKQHGNDVTFVLAKSFFARRTAEKLKRVVSLVSKGHVGCTSRSHPLVCMRRPAPTAMEQQGTCQQQAPLQRFVTTSGHDAHAGCTYPGLNCYGQIP